MTPTPLDLNNTNGKAKVEWTTTETQAEESARLVREDREHQFLVKMRCATFGFASLVVLVCVLVGVYLAAWHPSVEISRLGVGIIATVVTGSLGFLSGRATAPASR